MNVLRASAGRAAGVLDHRAVLALAVPAILEMVLHMAAWAVDTAMVGRLGASALSAVALGGQVYFTAAFILASTAIATGALVARATGAGDTLEATRAGAQGMLVAAAGGVVMALAAYLVAVPLFRAVALGPDVTRDGVAYLRTVAPAAACFLPLLMGSAILRARGDTRTPLVITAVVNAVNIAADWVLIYGRLGFEPQGVTGAARALLLGQLVGLILIIVAISRAFPWQREHFLSVGRASLARLFRIAVPAGLETLLIDGARLANILIISSLGPAALAATQVAVTAEALSFMPGHGFAIASGILAGQGLGAGRPDRVVRGTHLCRTWALGLMGMVGLTFILVPGFFIRIFTDDPDVIRLGSLCLRVAGFAQPFTALTETTLGSMRGMGDTRRAVMFTALGAWGIRVPLTLIVVRLLGLGLVAAWWAMVLDWLVRSILVTRYFHRGLWQGLKV